MVIANRRDVEEMEARVRGMADLKCKVVWSNPVLICQLWTLVYILCIKSSFKKLFMLISHMYHTSFFCSHKAPYNAHVVSRFNQTSTNYDETFPSVVVLTGVRNDSAMKRARALSYIERVCQSRSKYTL